MDSPRVDPVVHLELHTGDPEGAGALYASLFGWHAERVFAGGRGYLALQLGSRVGGGIVECDADPPVWLPYVQVASVGEATARAGLLGATVRLEPREGPAGWRSVVATREGGEVAFWQPKR